MGYPPIQIVNDQDQPVGAASMQAAQKKGLIHRIVRIMAEDSEGKLLLQKRAAKMKLYPNCWDSSAAGHVDEGEDYLHAAKRELAEEIGLETDELAEVGHYYTDRKSDGLVLRRFNKVYKLIIDQTPLNLQASEVAEVRWFSADEVKSLIRQSPDQVTDGLVDVMQRCY